MTNDIWNINICFLYYLESLKYKGLVFRHELYIKYKILVRQDNCHFQDLREEKKIAFAIGSNQSFFLYLLHILFDSLLFFIGNPKFKKNTVLDVPTS